MQSSACVDMRGRILDAMIGLDLHTWMEPSQTRHELICLRHQVYFPQIQHHMMKVTFSASKIEMSLLSHNGGLHACT